MGDNATAGRACDDAARAAIVRTAQDWIGTPYRHQMARKLVGCDCLGLIIGVAREVGLRTPDVLPPYTRDWLEYGSGEPLLEKLDEYLERRPCSEPAELGDVLVFRMAARMSAKHLGIQVSPASMVHSQERYGVHVAPLGQAWRRRLVAHFRFSYDQEDKEFD